MNENKKVKLDSLKHVSLEKSPTVTYQGVADAVRNFFDEARNARQTVEDSWQECYAQYIGTVEAQEWVNSFSTRQQLISNDWRHKVHLGKAHELIETFIAYLLSATFPNSQWFGLVPKQPEIAHKLPKLEVFFREILEQAELREETEKFYRQALLIGNSVMGLPWDNYNDVPKFETLDMFDFYPDPNAHDINKADVVRIIRKTRSEIASMMHSGKIENITATDIINLPASEEDKREARRNIKSWAGIELADAVSMEDVVDCYDYWGDLNVGTTTLKDVHVLVIGGCVAKLERNKFKVAGSKPFIFGTITQIPHVVYARGILHPVLGQLAMMDITHNQVLDNIELIINAMFTVVNDGTIDLDSVRNDPGNLILVQDHDAVQRMQVGSIDSVGYLEVDTLNQAIDRVVGSGPMVSAGPGRGGERVTAAEITATRDAGGNRLNQIHRHLERTFLLPVLRNTWKLMQSHKKGEGLVPLKVNRDERGYFKVPLSDLKLHLDFNVKGADHVVDREHNINEILAYVEAVSANPELAARQNWDELARRVAGTFDIFEDVEAVIAEPPPPGPSPEEQQLMAQQEQQQQVPPVNMNGIPLPGVAEQLGSETPLTMDASGMNFALQQSGVDGLTNGIAPPEGFPPIPE